MTTFYIFMVVLGGMFLAGLINELKELRERISKLEAKARTGRDQGHTDF